MDRILCQWLYDLGHQLLGVEHMETAALDKGKSQTPNTLPYSVNCRSDGKRATNKDEYTAPHLSCLATAVYIHLYTVPVSVVKV